MRLIVQAATPELQSQAKLLANKLQLGLVGEADFVLQLTTTGLQLQQLGKGAPGAVRADFVGGAAEHRRRFGGGAGQLIARAVGVQGSVRPLVLDATAGLGRDAFVLACLGCQVQMLERHPVVAALLADGLARAAVVPDTSDIVARMQLVHGDAINLFANWQLAQPEVIYLDPMFPQRDKSSLVKKEMRLFQPLVGGDEDAPDLLAAALQLASHRVVVKRPRKAAAIAGVAPSYSLAGKSSRFDIYSKKSLKKLQDNAE